MELTQEMLQTNTGKKAQMIDVLDMHRISLICFIAPAVDEFNYNASKPKKLEQFWKALANLQSTGTMFCVLLSARPLVHGVGRKGPSCLRWGMAGQLCPVEETGVSSVFGSV